MTWKTIPASEARWHHLYGLGGWLGLWLAMDLLALFGSVVTFAAMSLMGQMGQMGGPHMTVTMVYSLGTATTTLTLALKKHRAFRQVMMAMVLSNLLVSLALLASTTSSTPINWPLQLFMLTCPTLIWGSYFHVSQRVRVTFEHQIESDESWDAATIRLHLIQRLRRPDPRTPDDPADASVAPEVQAARARSREHARQLFQGPDDSQLDDTSRAELAELAMEVGIRPSDRDIDMLAIAACERPALLDKRVRKTRETLLHIAAKAGHFRAIQHLVSLGADRTAVDRRGRTPADVAANPAARSAAC